MKNICNRCMRAFVIHNLSKKSLGDLDKTERLFLFGRR